MAVHVAQSGRREPLPRDVRDSGPQFSVVLPCYNEESAIQQTIDELRAHLQSAGPYEIVAVDDGSTDQTAQLLEAAARRDPAVRVVRHKRNRGYGAALKSGIREASSPLIVTTDADGTYPNQHIVEFVEIAANCDMVVGARSLPWSTYPFLRRVPKLFLGAYCSWLARQPIPDINSGLRVFRRDVAFRFFRILPDGFSFTTTITLAMLTNHFRVRYRPIGYAARIGKSKIRPIRDTLNFVQLITRTGIYFAPLRVLMPLATALFALATLSFGSDMMHHNVTDKTIVLLMFSMNTLLFGLLADMINKLSGSFHRSDYELVDARDSRPSLQNSPTVDAASEERRAA